MKRKTKNKKMYHRLTFWLGVLVLGLFVGISIQFGRAWVEPSATAPENNIAAPINTGQGKQVKVGSSSNPADICVDKLGDGKEKCLGDLVTFPSCSLSGGIPISSGALTICKFAGSSCPRNVKISDTTTINWKQYLNYSETEANTCTGTGTCATSVTTGFHSFDNVSPATEALDSKTYSSGEKPWVVVHCPNNTCTGWTSWGCDGYYCSAADQVWGWGTCSTILLTCVPSKKSVGCVIE